MDASAFTPNVELRDFLREQREKREQSRGQKRDKPTNIKAEAEAQIKDLGLRPEALQTGSVESSSSCAPVGSCSSSRTILSSTRILLCESVKEEENIWRTSGEAITAQANVWSSERT